MDMIWANSVDSEEQEAVLLQSIRVTKGLDWFSDLNNNTTPKVDPQTDCIVTNKNVPDRMLKIHQSFRWCVVLNHDTVNK